MRLHKHVFTVVSLLVATAASASVEPADDIVVAITDLLARGAQVEQTEVISVRSVGRKRRSGHQNNANIALNAFGRHIRLKLRRNRRLVSRNFMLRNNMEASGYDESSVDIECYYIGSVLGEPASKAAVSLCDGGMRGMVYWGSGNKTLAIYPLPHDVNSTATVSDAHVIVSINQTTKLLTEFDESSDRVVIREYPREMSRHSPSHTRVPAALTMPSLGHRANVTRVRTQKAIVETAFFVDESLYKHIEHVFPRDTRRQVAIFALTLINQMQVVYEQESLGGLVSITLTYLEIMYPQAQDKIPSNQDYDYYLTSFCIYQQARRNTKDSEYTHWDYAVLISAMNLYARNKHGHKMKDVVGMTAVGGMCNELHSCALLEGRDLQSAHIIAHETGHSLGMEHDGEGDNSVCPWNKFIMSSTTGFTKKTWSKCSLKSLQAFLNTERADCLYKRSSNKNFLAGPESRIYKLFPGVHYTADQQCEMKFGDGYRRAGFQNLEDVCRILKCEQKTGEALLVRNTHGYTAMEGTQCGRNKWCRGGVCTEITNGDHNLLRESKEASLRNHGNSWNQTPLPPPRIPMPPPLLPSSARTPVPEQPVQASWTPWSAWGHCESGCTARVDRVPKAIRISIRSCIDINTNTTLPSDKCAKSDSGGNIKSQLCQESICNSSRASDLDRMIQDTCIAAMERNTSYSGTGTQFHQNDERYSCRIWCRRDNGIVDYMGVLPDGAECYAHDQPANKFCVKGNCMRFDCQGNSIQVHREPRREEWTCIAPAVRLPSKSTTKKRPTEDESARGGSGSRKQCKHSCIRGGRGTLLQLGCADCAMDSMGLCDDRSECSSVIEVNEYATNLCKKHQRRYTHLFNGVGIQKSYKDDDDVDEQCVVACQDLFNPLMFYGMDTLEDTRFPPGTPCLAEGRAQGYCHFGKCVDERKFEASLYRTTQQGEQHVERKINTDLRRGTRTKRWIFQDIYIVSLKKTLANLTTT
ncbi:A disintegrin and metalloproteinase with thrombospondin motifs adt-1-like isoform X2 [Varroa jacobsoni]|uniref:A disintegrin and metalloproteinase with thrombospondin motifs adt-1-like isoform X2 n=1 Tax=Varroa jacobsoni TaxID=62625 RepID=UPI000BF2F76A|nr:A disintegrin and metalloproteinase with thrombospondin motifs adt-1-like isoform X2 [Varroa jacobsoni]